MGVREFFDDVQMAAESGGRQKDSSGKTIVGRYRDGSMPPPSQRAYGAGQMQVGTARNVAKAHKIPWDESKFMNDREYNLRLADAHMRDLTVKYGDRTIARAAYHSGEPNVDRAIAKYGRQGFARGLGPEGRNYIKMGQPRTPDGLAYNAEGSGGGIVNPDAYLAALQSSLAPESKASENVRQPADAIFGSDEELGRRADAVENELQWQGQAINTLDDVTQALQATQVKAAEEQLNDTKAVSNEIVEGTKQLSNQVKPVFAARSRIADQLDKINSMNPLERGIRGIFDLNYDRKYLENQLDHYDKTLQARASDFDYMNKLHSIALQEIDRRYGMETAMPALLVEQSKEDLGIVGMRLQQTAGMLGNLKDRVGTEAQMIAAKATAREDLLGRLDSPTVLDLANQAKTGGGVVKFNGVEFSYHELRTRLETDEHRELEMESYRMAIANNRMDMADKYATNIARSLTREQTEAAIANGGVYNGIKLPVDVLTGTLQSHLAQGQAMAQSIASNLPASTALQAATDSVNQINGLYQRTKGIFGNKGVPGATSYLQRGADLTRMLVKATENEAPPEVITALTQQIAENSAKMVEATDRGILQSVGGDKRAADYMKSFVYGTPIQSGTAIEAITYFASKGNLPEGMALSDEGKAIFQQAQKLIQNHRQDRVNGKVISQKALEQLVNQELTQFAGATVGGARFNRIWGSLPALAKTANHPIAKIGNENWARSLANAKQDAAAALARVIDTTPDVVLQMERTMRPVANTPEAKELFQKFQQTEGRFNAVEQASLIRELDDLPQIQPGRRNSSLMIDFMGSPDMHKFAGQYTSAVGSQSMGDYLVNPLANGALEKNLGDYATGLRTAQAESSGAARRNARRQAAATAYDPSIRLGVILRSIDGVGKSGATALQPVVNSLIEEYHKNPTVTVNTHPWMTASEGMKAQEDFVFNRLSAMRFKDQPALEAYRKTAVKGWEQSSTQTRGFLEVMMDALNPFGE